jgi:hypothetical protein
VALDKDDLKQLGPSITPTSHPPYWKLSAWALHDTMSIRQTYSQKVASQSVAQNLFLGDPYSLESSREPRLERSMGPYPEEPRSKQGLAGQGKTDRSGQEGAGGAGRGRWGRKRQVRPGRQGRAGQEDRIGFANYPAPSGSQGSNGTRSGRTPHSLAKVLSSIKVQGGGLPG